MGVPESQNARLLSAGRGLTSARQLPLPLYDTPPVPVLTRIWAEKPVMIPGGVRSPTMLTVNLLPSGTLAGTSSRMAVTVPWLAA